MDRALLRVLVKNLKNAANDCNTRKHPTQWQGSQHRLKICEQCPYVSCCFSTFSSSPASLQWVYYAFQHTAQTHLVR